MRTWNRIQLTTLKVAALGSVAFVLAAVGVILSLTVLPDFLSVTLGLMGIALLLLGFLIVIPLRLIGWLISLSDPAEGSD